MLPDPDQRQMPGASGAVDLIVLGSGAAGLTAALTALLEGLSVTVLEIADRFGGTSARSSGTVWIPDNALMRAAGFAPDREAAETYLDALVGTLGPREPWLAFLDAAPKMQADLEARAGIAFRPYLAAPDYQSDLPGAALGGRPLEPAAFDGRRLGKWFALIAPPLPELTILGGMMVTRAEAGRLIRADRSISALAEGARLVLRHARDRTRWPRGTRLVMGNALIARLVEAVLSRGGALYENAHVTEVQKDGERIAGVTGLWKGSAFTLRARYGVVLAGGGFPADPDKRASNLPSPVAQHTAAAPTARGKTIDLGIAAGGTAGPPGRDNALWFPSSLWARPDGGLAVYPHIALDRAKPGSIAIDSTGRRFANEALSYHDFCRAIYDRGPAAVPCWLIGDRDFLRRYGMGVIRPRTLRLKRYIAGGYLKHGADAAALARAICVPADALVESIARFNQLARSGQDRDFGRGETAYERANGDASRGEVNPCLGPVGLRDLYAVALWPTPLGTSRGLMASDDGEVLDAGGRPVPGLYVAGNDMQSCFAGEYPGAGAQIGQGMTFGWRVARHAARANRDGRTEW